MKESKFHFRTELRKQSIKKIWIELEREHQKRLRGYTIIKEKQKFRYFEMKYILKYKLLFR